MMFKKKWVSCLDNLQDETLVTLHYFLVLLNSPTVHRPSEGCGRQPRALSGTAWGPPFYLHTRPCCLGRISTMVG